jgi:hypothetical protein
MVYCMYDSTMDIFRKRWRMLLQFDMKVFYGQWDEIQGIFQSFEGHFSFYLETNKGRQLPSCCRWQTPISAEKKLFYTKVSNKVIKFDRVLLSLLTQPVIILTQKGKYTHHLVCVRSKPIFYKRNIFFIILKAVLIQTGT